METDGLGTQRTDSATVAAVTTVGGNGGGAGRTGDQADATEDAPLVATPVFDFSPLTPRGQVVDAATGLPLAGVEVQWVLGQPPGGVVRPVVLAAGHSDANGDYALRVAHTDDACAALGQMACGLVQASYLAVPGEREVPATTVVVERPGSEVTVRVRAEGGLTDDDWGLLAGFLMTNRMVRSGDLLQQLTEPLPDAPTVAWSAGRRAFALAQVQRAYGVGVAPIAPFGIEPPEYPLDLEALGKADVEKAVNHFRLSDLFEQLGGDRAQWETGIYFNTLPKSDRVLYRDYLRAVWVAAAQRMYKSTPVTPTVAQLERQLDDRLGQNFHTGNDAKRPPADLLVGLLRTYLVMPTSRGGWGLATAALPAQGTAGNADYLPMLLAAAGTGAQEVRNRFRVQVLRADVPEVSPVDLNVEALQGLLADTYQSPEEPFPTPIAGAAENPLIFGRYVGRAPFFLQYEEWLERQATFYPENVYDIRRVLTFFEKRYRDEVVSQKTAVHPNTSPDNDYIADQNDWHQSAAWMELMFPVIDTIRAALATADLGQYPGALQQLNVAVGLIDDARKKAKGQWYRDSFPWLRYTGVWNDPADRRISLHSRAIRPVKTPGDLAAFEAYFDAKNAPMLYSWENAPGPDFADWVESWLARVRTLSIHHLRYLQYVLAPYLRATILQAMGDYRAAIDELEALTGYDTGVANPTDTAVYRDTQTLTTEPFFLQGWSLPYTVAVGFDTEDKSLYWDRKPDFPIATIELAPFEQRFFKLAQGDIMLAWADQLYRNDDPSSIRRARELYKGVIFMHGEDPEIAPHFSRQRYPLLPMPGGVGAGLGGPPVGNPQRLSQVARARQGFQQIELGLNAYGYSADMVPLLRYKPLKQAADLFCTAAKSAQTDFLNYVTRLEQAQIEGWQAAALVKKAEAGQAIAQEHVAIAKAGVAKAQEQVAAVKAQIAAKQAEIADSNSFFSQVSDFFGGMKGTLEGMVPLAEKVMADDSAAGAVTGDQLTGIFTKAIGSSSAGKEAAVAALGSGAALTIGFGAFAYVGYTTMGNMADAYAKRDGDLKSLQQGALPAAEAQVRLRERDVTIANHEVSIARAELDLARALDRFQRERFLNVDVWNKLSAFAHRVLRRMVELGARAAWLAERALAYEQGRDIRIIRMNYLPTQLRGLTGPDRLLLDLAELEANRLQGVRLTAPVKHTVSLAKEFPLQFGQLKQTGRCSFHTNEAALRTAYPGTFAYRIRALTVAADAGDERPPRGIIRNYGVSHLGQEDGKSTKRLLRFPDGLPLSEFRLHDDLFLYGLPGETLLQFEGSGFDTDWEVEFPLAANPQGLQALNDLVLTFDMNASYSNQLSLGGGGAANPVTRAVLAAASRVDAVGLAGVRAGGPAPAVLRFDLGRLQLPVHETNRTVTNLALVAVGRTTQPYAATLDAATLGAPVPFQFTAGLALSNAGQLQGTAASAPLNGLVGQPLDQTLTVEIDRTGVEDEVQALHDLVLYVEYQTDV